MEAISRGFHCSSTWLGSASMGSGQWRFFIDKRSCLDGASVRRVGSVPVVAVGMACSSLVARVPQMKRREEYRDLKEKRGVSEARVSSRAKGYYFPFLYYGPVSKNFLLFLPLKISF
ncbi:LOW QUALITY PROTEIN: hypothetical protein PanWU01x14_088550 [Parasponia andersonii]|uniref:Uncharacterized protein n=1 Tax=Parasponia andersonii TaxID=3476 RepID=A0A2P5D804_PARAD|nr:LOW QUALITY PROTEIN: hypothetical protein PanWU01x14_088550 [Parasponia andersonii]